LVLVVSGVFLLGFLREVYPIHEITERLQDRAEGSTGVPKAP
jgi:hypothetical protein